MRRIASLLLVAALLAAGCSSLAGAGPSASSGEPSEPSGSLDATDPRASLTTARPAASMPLPSLRPAESPGASTPTPSPDESLFWQLTLGGAHAYAYESVREIVEASDVVVVGTLSGVRPADRTILSPGEPYESFIDFALVTVEIEEVLKGEPVTRTPGRLDWRITIGQSTVETVASVLPTGRYMLFLIHGPNDLAPDGSPEEKARWRFVYSNTNGGIVGEVDGLATDLTLDQDPALFPTIIAGQPFEELRERVRQAASKAE